MRPRNLVFSMTLTIWPNSWPAFDWQDHPTYNIPRMDKLRGLRYKLRMIGVLLLDHPLSMATTNWLSQTHLDPSWCLRRNAIQSAITFAASRLQWMNRVLPTLIPMTTGPTFWPKWPVALNDATSFAMSFMTSTITNNDKTSHGIMLPYLILRGLK